MNGEEHKNTQILFLSSKHINQMVRTVILINKVFEEDDKNIYLTIFCLENNFYFIEYIQQPIFRSF